jgi:hypothetical protein
MVKTKQLIKLLDKASFTDIFLIWLGVIIIFGFIYSINTSAMLTEPTSFLNAIYFSFITATTAGFGDIIPTGIGKIIVIIEVLISLLIYGVVISKIVSIKQEAILDEIYTISFQERITRLRSMLYLFRSDLNRVIERMNDGKSRTTTVRESAVYFHTFANTMSDIDKLLSDRDTDSHYIKGVDFSTFELILNSIIISMDKVTDFFNLIQKTKTPVNKVIFSYPLGMIYNVNKKILHKYGEIDDERVKNKLFMLETLNKRIKTEIAIKKDKT